MARRRTNTALERRAAALGAKRRSLKAEADAVNRQRAAAHAAAAKKLGALEEERRGLIEGVRALRSAVADAEAEADSVDGGAQ